MNDSQWGDGMKNVLITGGSSGIGRALVRKFAKLQYRVWFTYRSGKDRADSLLQELSDCSVQAFYFDQGNWESHQNLLEALPGDVEIFFNNAALGSATVESYCPGEEHRQDQMMIQVNAVGALWLTKAILPQMLKNSYGKIVMVSSVNGGINLFPGFSLSDGMSKAALAFMTKQLAAELIYTPIDVFGICPGATDTTMFQESTLNALNSEQRSKFVDSLPKKQLISPEQIAEIAYFLCSEEAKVLHGSILDASFGLGVHPGSLLRKRGHL